MSRTLSLFLAGLAALVLLAGTSLAQADKNAKAEGKKVTLEVKLPADAKLFIDGKETKATGPVRRFVSPAIAEVDGAKYVYTLKAVIADQNGDQVITRQIEVKPGEEKKVELSAEQKDKDKDREPDVIYVPTPQEAVEAMLKLAKVTDKDVVWDLGCGDGRIPVTAAKIYKIKARGFDVDPERIKDSLENVKKNDVGKLVTIEKKDIFTLDLSKEPTVITLYLLPELNVKLLPQLVKLPKGARVVSHAFRMGDIKPDAEQTVKTERGEVTIYLWKVETLQAGFKPDKKE
jgi:uncharacterized protein (TIGR03000 family)